MELSKKLVKEFQKIMKEEYGQELSFKQASETAHALVTYFDILRKLCIKQKERKDKK